MWQAGIFFIIYILNHTLVEMRDGMLPPCDSKKLVHFLAEVQVVDPESIIKQATLNELESLCKKITKGLEETHYYLKSCDPPFQKDLYLRLIKGVDSLHHKLCKKNGHFIETFKKYHPCCHQTDYKKCTGPADWVEDSNATKICSAYKEISNCYYTTTTASCSEEAGKIIKELFDGVVASILTVNCDGSKSGLARNGEFGEFASAAKGFNKSTNIDFYLCLIYFVTIILC